MIQYEIEEYNLNDIFDNEEKYQEFDEKRKKGENCSYLCNLIQNDSIVEFITYINQKNIQHSAKIQSSIYETNPLFIEDDTDLIYYSAFYGSIQIYQYLRTNNAKIDPFIWIFAIHSNNAELISLIEEDKINPPTFLPYPNIREINSPSIFNYKECMKEAIKCHHNDIFNYIQNNLVNNEIIYIEEEEEEYDYVYEYNDQFVYDNDILKWSFKYLNYSIIQSINENTSVNHSMIKYSCIYNYYSIVKILLEKGKIDFKPYLDSQKFESNANKNNYEIINLLLPHLSIDNLQIFKDCHYLTQVCINSSIKSIDDYCFENCSKLTEVIIPSSVSSIGFASFRNCSSLKQITIPSSVISIDDYCFSECSSLTEVSIPSSVKSIGKYCFKRCSSLKQIIIPSSVKSIDDYCFSQCSSLIELTIPSSVISYEENIIEDCSSLKEITIHSSISSYKRILFNGCSSLNKVNITSPFIQFIEMGSFKESIMLKEINLPPSTILIEQETFENCSSLSKIAIPSSVTLLGNNCFKGCISTICDFNR